MSTSTPVRSEANLEPVDRQSDLKLWWNPQLAECYRCYTVQLTDRQPAPLGSVELTFSLMGEEAMKLPPNQREGLTVDLYNAPLAVWPELPTTIANAAVGQFGFILLSDEYVIERVGVEDPRSIAESGGKYPAGAGMLPMEGKGAATSRSGT